MFLILKSIPIVVMKVGENDSFAYLNNRQVLPTPLQGKSVEITAEMGIGNRRCRGQKVNRDKEGKKDG